MMFDYAEFTSRNIGFVTLDEQAKLRGACIMWLVLAGIGELIIIVLDEFEISNLNRQVFAFDHTMNQHKAEATPQIVGQINPKIEIEVHHGDWTDTVDAGVERPVIVVNSTDDLSARGLEKSVINAYTSPPPSVYVTGPNDQKYKDRLGNPNVETDWDKITDDQRSKAFKKESEWVVTHSSYRNYIDPNIVGDAVADKRPRMSFAPMVITTCQLMCYEVVNAILGRGYFFNPYMARIERSKPAIMRLMGRKVLIGLMQ